MKARIEGKSAAREMPRSAIEDCKKINGPLPSPGDFIRVQSLGEHFPAFKVTKVVNTDIVDGNQEVVFTIVESVRSPARSVMLFQNENAEAGFSKAAVIIM